MQPLTFRNTGKLSSLRLISNESQSSLASSHPEKIIAESEKILKTRDYAGLKIDA